MIMTTGYAYCPACGKRGGYTFNTIDTVPDEFDAFEYTPNYEPEVETYLE